MSDSGKFSIYDDRIIQHKPEYAVYKGGESITNTVFNAISQNTAQHNFNCPVPSPNIFVDRAVDWSATCALMCTVTIGNAAGQAGIANDATAATVPVITLGKDMALCAFPLHSMTQTMTATINDVVVSMNTAELLPQILRLTDHRKNLIQRTCPSMLDTYGNYNDGYGSTNSPLNSYYESVTGSYNTNGAYGRVGFCDPNTGTPLAGNGSYTFNAIQVSFTNGVPNCSNVAGNGIGTIVNVPIGIYFTSTEKLVLPPFIFADSKEMSTGLFGINAFQLLMNIVSSTGLQRVIRSTSANFRTITAGSVAFINNGFSNSKLNVLFITPNLAVPLPRISSVPWLEMPRYTTAFSTAIPAGALGTEIQSNNIVLPCIPDYFMIFVKPQASGYGVNDADWLLPITSINLNFNNFSGLMNNMTQEQLYHAGVQNGLDVDYALYNGKCRVAPNGLILNNLKQLCGAPLLIKPGKDFHLSQGLACGVNGNFNVQFSVKVDNYGGAIPQNAGLLLYLVCINSGFFESQGGSSRIIRAPLNEADVISAPTVGILGKQRMERMVGGGFFDKISSIVNKAADIYKSSKPAISAAKNMLPDGKVKDAMSAVGYGKNARSMANRVDA